MNSELRDPFGRKIEYIRLSVTDRCDLRCSYCMPQGYDNFNDPEHWLTFDEIARIVRAFSELGVNRVRMTGGEPLVRRHLPVLVEKLANTPGIEDLSLSTNGVQLSRQANKLYDAGINRLNVSLDTLDPTLFHQLTGGGKLSKVLEGLMAAKAAGFGPIKINMVVMNGVNDHEVVAMTRFCMQHGFILRFIETMPMGEGGQSAFNAYLPLDVVKERLERHYRLSPCITPGGGPARYMRVDNSDLTVGFITPISQHFCETCNRIRLSVDGTLYMCVGHNDNYPLRELLRSGISDRELQGHIRKAISLKPQRHHFNGDGEQVIRPMGYTGG